MTHNPNVKKRPYRLQEYDPEWPKLFQQYAAQIREVLGDNIVAIEHFGSTSIPGMFAKPNIDIYVLVQNLEEVRKSAGAMVGLGFTAHGDYSHIGEEYFTLDQETGERIASVHVFQSPNERFSLYKNFRNYLTENEEARERYITLKRELYKKYADDYPKYDEGKQELINQLITEANNWAKNLETNST